MDAYLAVVSKREVRRYAPRPLPDDLLRRILEAGRASGSSRNRQPGRFVVVRDRERLARLATLLSRPENLAGAAAGVALTLTQPRALFDAGRAAQNLMVAAWTLGVGTCPNTPTDAEGVQRLLEVPEGLTVPTVISMGFPAPGQPRPRAGRDPEAILRRVDRLPLHEIAFAETYGRPLA
jgi:nitroreductase